MNLKYPIGLLAVVVLGSSTFTYAQPRDRGRHEADRGEVRNIHQRMKTCHERIERGIGNGSLSREEAHRLKRELDNVRDDEARMRSDGKLSRREADRLDKELNRLERHISALKSNDNRRRR